MSTLSYLYFPVSLVLPYNLHNLPNQQDMSTNTNRKHSDGANSSVVVCNGDNSNPSRPTHKQQGTGGDSFSAFTDVCLSDVSPHHRSVYRPNSGSAVEGLVEMKKDVNEWHQVARVLDRLFLFVYLILAAFYGVLVFYTL